jgi:hypothetical protein
MARLYELRSHEGDSDLLAVVDLDKVCVIHIQREAGHRYISLRVRFVDGHEDHDMVPPQAAQHFLDAYREHLREQSGKQP